MRRATPRVWLYRFDVAGLVQECAPLRRIYVLFALEVGDRYLHVLGRDRAPRRTTPSARTARCNCVHHARKHLFPSQPTAGSSVNQSSAG
jgi:hypothetical protein